MSAEHTELSEQVPARRGTDAQRRAGRSVERAVDAHHELVRCRFGVVPVSVPLLSVLGVGGSAACASAGRDVVGLAGGFEGSEVLCAGRAGRRAGPEARTRRARHAIIAGVPFPIVLIDVTPPAQDDAHLATMAQACSRAVLRGECVVFSRESEPATPAVAIVRWNDAASAGATIQVGIRGTSHAQWRSRAIDFSPGDAVDERWRAIGLTVATLVGEIDAGGDAGPPIEPRPTPREEARVSPTPATSPADPPRSAPPTAWADLSFLGGPGLAPGRPRFGANVAGSWRPRTLPFFGRLALKYATSAPNHQSVSAQWAGAGLGLGGQWEPATDLGLSVSGGPVVELVRAAASDATGRTDSGTRWLVGAEISCLAVWPSRSPLAGIVGVDVSRMPRTVGVRLHGSRVTESPATKLGVFVGIRIAP